MSQTLKLLLGTVSAVGNFFIVMFLGLTFAAQPAIYRKGLLFLTPARQRARATIIVDRIGENPGTLVDRTARHHGRGVFS